MFFVVFTQVKPWKWLHCFFNTLADSRETAKEYGTSGKNSEFFLAAKDRQSLLSFKFFDEFVNLMGFRMVKKCKVISVSEETPKNTVEFESIFKGWCECIFAEV